MPTPAAGSSRATPLVVGESDGTQSVQPDRRRSSRAPAARKYFPMESGADANVAAMLDANLGIEPRKRKASSSSSRSSGGPQHKRRKSSQAADHPPAGPGYAQAAAAKRSLRGAMGSASTLATAKPGLDGLVAYLHANIAAMPAFACNPCPLIARITERTLSCSHR
jgi:hypothetical protein